MSINGCLLKYTYTHIYIYGCKCFYIHTYLHGLCGAQGSNILWRRRGMQFQMQPVNGNEHKRYVIFWNLDAPFPLPVMHCAFDIAQLVVRHACFLVFSGHPKPDHIDGDMN